MLKSPVGTLTFLMTDIEGSTRMWEAEPKAMAAAVLRSEQIINEVVTDHDGYHVKEQGEGDSTLSVFNHATQAALAAQDIRDRLAAERWPEGVLIRVRTGLHSGVADMREQTYYGRAVNRAARVRAVAHGGQIILSRATKELLDPQVFPELKDHGLHRLKDLLQPEHLFELPCNEEFPKLLTLSSRPTNLPLQLTNFVGRQVDIQDILQRILNNRIVTLLGPGGTGKTRLALQVAAEACDHFPQGVFFVDLVSATSTEDVWGQFSRTVGVEALEELTPAKLLVVFDNCEQLIPVIAPIAKQLLTTIPSLAILATSREPLQLHGEVEYRVSPLSLPRRHQAKHVSAALESEAVQLFVARAIAKDQHFSLTDANCAIVAEICTHLDGLPLAIELAVPRLRILGPEGLLARINERFVLFRDRDRTTAERHQTLAAAIDHSYDHLDSRECIALMHLAVFRSGWTLESAEAVMPDDIRASTLDVIESLTDKSFVQTAEDSVGGRRGFLLETIREYALQKLTESGALDTARARLCEWQTAFANKREELISLGSPNAVEEMDLEIANVAGSLEWCANQNRRELGLPLAIAFWQHWRRRAMFDSARKIVRSLIGNDVTPNLQAMAYGVLGTLAWYQLDLDDALRCYEESLRLYKESGDARGFALATNNLGLIAASTLKSETAANYFTQAQNRFRDLGDAKNELATAVNLGVLELDRGNATDALQALERALVLAESSGDVARLGILYTDLAEANLLLGDGHQSARWLLRSLENLEASGFDMQATIHALVIAGGIAGITGKQDVACAAIGCAQSLRCKAGLEAQEREVRIEQLANPTDGLPNAALNRQFDSLQALEAIQEVLTEVRPMLDGAAQKSAP